MRVNSVLTKHRGRCKKEETQSTWISLGWVEDVVSSLLGEEIVQTEKTKAKD